MRRWKDAWERRGETLVTVGIGSGFLWAATILASPSAQVSVWPPLGVCAFLVLVGAYMWIAPSLERVPLPGRAAAIAVRSQEHPSFKDHVADLHRHAGAVMDVIYRPFSGGGYFETRAPVHLDASATREFASHFASVAALIEEWNSAADGYGKSSEQLGTAITQKIDQLLPNRARGEMPDQLLDRIAIRYYDIEQAVWSEEPGDRLNIRFQDGTVWCVVLSLASAPAGFAEEIKAALEALPHLPEAVDMWQRNALFARVRPKLMEQLAEAQRTHNPDGNCDKCP